MGFLFDIKIEQSIAQPYVSHSIEYHTAEKLSLQ